MHTHTHTQTCVGKGVCDRRSKHTHTHTHAHTTTHALLEVQDIHLYAINWVVNYAEMGAEVNLTAY